MAKNNTYSKLVILFILSTLALQIASYIAIKYGFGTTNELILFGQFFNNSIAILISALAIALLIIFIILFKRIINFWSVLVFAGAISNLIDRCRLGGVNDYFSLPHFFVFNLADVVIIIGAIGLFFVVISQENKNTLSTFRK